MTSLKRSAGTAAVLVGAISLAACSSGNSTGASSSSQIATYDAGYDYGSDLLKDTYDGEEPDVDEAIGACGDGVDYERERLYSSNSLTPIQGSVPITSEETEAYDALKEKIGKDPGGALDAYEQGCSDALNSEPATPSIWDKAAAIAGDPYTEGYSFATYKLPILQDVAEEEGIEDPVEETISVCQVKVLIALDQLPLERSENLDPSEWESAKGIEDRHREFIAGCEDAAIGKVERTTS
ncbi:hypothetical protein [Streptomyces viridosporus]|uniref:DUF732 domain-containing protein n=1 Tax=Streptomyces viridosporus T7A TaxID=665577 RepID=A0ABX6AEM2_STRVD|nr:hypothetical protein [Streptomyces viridosporus]QEU86262.1 hypothetical protein CP969_17320 [Streptomyces viridosporus T7A]